MKVKYEIFLVNTSNRVYTDNIDFSEIGIWVNNDLAKPSEGVRVFIPYVNIIKLIEYTT